MKLLLITGAGASRNLSADPNKPMPLMADWAETLRTDFGPNLAAMTGLTDAATGLQFEETLGALFRWHEQLDQAGRFSGMARSAHTDPQYQTLFEKGLDHARAHFGTVLKTLHRSLFQEFGPDRIDAERARAAYETLFTWIGDFATDPLEIICATTNYDRSLEAGLEAMGETVRAGFEPHSFRTPTLDPAGLGIFGPDVINLLYLHGAVGWYRRGDRITSQAADAPYNSSLGDPAVLYPGPDKDMGRSETVELWREFEAAVGDATHVLVLGHALNDAHLVAALGQAGSRVAVSVYPHDDVAMSDQAKTVRQRLPAAYVVGLDFGPSPAVDSHALAAWQADARSSQAPEGATRRMAGAK